MLHHSRSYFHGYREKSDGILVTLLTLELSVAAMTGVGVMYA